MPKELFIDVSEYEAPQPFEEVIQLLLKLKVGEYIRMLHRKKPLPLLQFLQENGFDFNVRQNQLLSDNEAPLNAASNVNVLWEIIIWNKKDTSVNQYCLNTF